MRRRSTRSFWWLIDVALLLAGRLHDQEGQPLRAGPPDPDQPNAGFWVRTAAMATDSLLLSLVFGTLSLGLLFAAGGAAMMAGDPTALDSGNPANQSRTGVNAPV